MQLLFLLIIVLFHTPPLIAQGSCPQNFTLSKGHCVHISTDKKTYCQAQDFCLSIGGELATGWKVTTLDIQRRTYYYIGLTDFLDETASMEQAKAKISFRWTNGSFATDLFDGKGNKNTLIDTLSLALSVFSVTLKMLVIHSRNNIPIRKLQHISFTATCFGNTQGTHIRTFIMRRKKVKTD